jgi:hypothetical protein
VATFTERAIDALNSYLTDGATGLNAETLPALRTALGITTANLPDVATVEQWYHRAAQANAFPYLSITVDSTSGEVEANSRFYDVRLQLALVVLDANIDGNEVDVVTALWRYGDAIKTIMQRRTGAGSQGWTLGQSSGIIRATVDAQTPGADPGLAVPNVALLTDLTIRTSESY